MKKILFFGSFCFHHLAATATAIATAATATAGFDSSLNSLAVYVVWEFRTNSKEEEESRPV